jgi:hypothetical protein
VPAGANRPTDIRLRFPDAPSNPAQLLLSPICLLSKELPVASEVQQKAAAVVAEHRDWFVAAGRLGFATKGVVYGIVGVLAIAAAWQGGRAEGSEGAIRRIGEQPLGQILLWLTAGGLAGYALWRFVQAMVEAECPGGRWKDLLRRGGFLVSGVVHVAMAVYAAPLSLGQIGGESHKGLVEGMLSLPGGQFLVAAVGVGILIFACCEIYLAWSQNFMREYENYKMTEAQRKTAQYAGTLGLAARGVTFLIVGFFVILAAIRLDPNQTKGVGEALEVLARQAFGPWLLALTGLGLAAYAVYCGTQAFYRRFS